MFQAEKCLTYVILGVCTARFPSKPVLCPHHQLWLLMRGVKWEEGHGFISYLHVGI